MNKMLNIKNSGYYFVICEAQCAGFEHVKVNAAFVLTLSLAFPEKRFLFLAEQGHLQLVKAELSSYQRNNIDFTEICTPERTSTPLGRLLPDILLMYNLLKELYRFEIANLMLLSINSTLLLALKLLLRFKFLYINVLVVPHSILASIKDRLPLRPWYWLLRFKLILKLGNMARIRYLILGPSIHQNLSIEMPSIDKYCSIINLPYILKERSLPKTDSKIVLAYLGVAHKNKGFDKFLSVADSVCANCDNSGGNDYEFICIGGLVDNSISSDSLLNISMPFMGKHIPEDEFNKLCSQITYAVFPYKNTAYKLYPSGAVFDAFVHLKPIICTRNSYFVHLFESLGDIGYLCDNEEEMTEVIQSIINEFPAERYQQQCRNIETGRSHFDPVNLSENLKAIVNEFKHASN